MFFGPDILAMPLAMALAASPAGHSLDCIMPKAPQVSVKVITADIRYDFSKSSRDLSLLKGDSVSPYAPGSDVVSGGLREDHPSINTQMEWEVEIDQRRNVACMWYQKITVQIRLEPKIYVAREFNNGPCRDAVLQHEHKHVDMDRIVLNKFAADTGQAVQKAVDSTGVLGPFNYSDVEQVKDRASRQIEAVMDARRAQMEKDMAARQSQIDSLAEYERVSQFCQNIKVGP